MRAVFSHTGTGLTVLFEDQRLNYVYLYSSTLYIWASLVAQMVKNPPAMWGTRVHSLDWEDPLEKGMAPHSRILAWKIPWMEDHGVAKSQTRLSDFTFAISFSRGSSQPRD